MHFLINIILSVVLTAGLLALIARTGAFKAGLIALANNAQIVNITPRGQCTVLADAGITIGFRYAVVSRDIGQSWPYVVLSGIGSVPFAICDDMTPATDTAPSNYPIKADILGMCEDTKRAIAHGAIAIDDLVTTYTGGYVQTMTGIGAGTYWIVGKCKQPTTNGTGDQIELIPCFPYQVTVAA